MNLSFDDYVDSLKGTSMELERFTYSWETAKRAWETALAQQAQCRYCGEEFQPDAYTACSKCVRRWRDSLAQQAQPLTDDEIGPRPGALTCVGCPALVLKHWSEREFNDSGTIARCSAADNRSISAYWTPNRPPEWCPARDRMAQQAHGEPRDAPCPYCGSLVERSLLDDDFREMNMKRHGFIVTDAQQAQPECKHEPLTDPVEQIAQAFESVFPHSGNLHKHYREEARQALRAIGYDPSQQPPERGDNSW